MIRIALVEDEADVRAQLQGYVQRHTRQYGTEFAVTEFADGMELLDDYRPVYDILFLDVEMKHLDGMETARRVRELDKDVIIVFITNMAQYAIKGYEVDALDFILKPLNYYTFSMRFTRAVGRVKNREGKRICLNLPDGAKFLDSREIYYVEIQNRMLHYHTKAGVFTIRGALKDVQEELEDWHFVKCNQCYLVNLKYVSEIRKNIAVVGGDELEISRRNRPAFLSAVVDFLGG